MSEVWSDRRVLARLQWPHGHCTRKQFEYYWDLKWELRETWTQEEKERHKRLTTAQAAKEQARVQQNVNDVNDAQGKQVPQWRKDRGLDSSADSIQRGKNYMAANRKKVDEAARFREERDASRLNEQRKRAEYLRQQQSPKLTLAQMISMQRQAAIRIRVEVSVDMSYLLTEGLDL